MKICAIVLQSVMLILAACSAQSGNTILWETVSPSGEFKAVVFERNAGATTSFTTQFSVISAPDEIGYSSGNVFIADCDHGKAPSAEWGGPEVKVEWIGDDQLVVTHHRFARLFKSELGFEHIQIEYLDDQETVLIP